MLLANRSIRFRKDQIEKIEELGIEVSEYIRELVDRDNLDEEIINKKIENYKESIKKLLELKQKIADSVNPSKLSQEEKRFLQESRQIFVETGSQFLLGRFNAYKKLYSKHCSITIEMFKKLVENSHKEENE